MGALIDMRDQLHRSIVLGRAGGDAEGTHAARQRLAASLLAYASSRAGTPTDLAAALQRFLSATDSPDPRLRQNASERLNRLLMDELATEQRRAIVASVRLEEIRARAIRLANELNIAWALLATAAGIVAAMLVRRHQRLSEEVRRLDRDRAQELEQFAGRVAHDIVSPLGPVSVGVHYFARKVAANDEQDRGAV